MKKFGKTVTTYLIEGTPSGPRYLTISNRTCKMYIIPRASLSIISQREELSTPAFYILLGEDDSLSPQAYLGETENFQIRGRNHEYNKDFWQRALIFIAKDEAMTKADVQYIEHLAYLEAHAARQFHLGENKQAPKQPRLPEYQRDSIREFFEDIKFLTSFSGCRIFDAVEAREQHLFYMKGLRHDVRGFYGDTGFTVLKGGLVSSVTAPFLSWAAKRAALLTENTSPAPGESLTLCENLHFSSPSAAASFCTGSSANGWAAWRDKEGKSLSDIYRESEVS